MLSRFRGQSLLLLKVTHQVFFEGARLSFWRWNMHLIRKVVGMQLRRFSTRLNFLAVAVCFSSLVNSKNVFDAMFVAWDPYQQRRDFQSLISTCAHLLCQGYLCFIWACTRVSSLTVGIEEPTVAPLCLDHVAIQLVIVAVQLIYDCVQH